MNPDIYDVEKIQPRGGLVDPTAQTGFAAPFKPNAPQPVEAAPATRLGPKQLETGEYLSEMQQFPTRIDKDYGTGAPDRGDLPRKDLKTPAGASPYHIPKTGDPDIDSLRPLIAKFAKSVPYRYREDAIQNGLLEALEAKQRFKPGSNTKFSTFAHDNTQTCLLYTSPSPRD